MSSKANRALSDVTASLDRFQRNMEAVGQLGAPQYQAYADLAAESITPRARQYMMMNLGQSGVGTMSKKYQSTGNLKTAVGKSQVIARTDGQGNVKVSVRMPPQAPRYKNGAELYEAAGAINYGAVRSPKTGGRSVLGAKAKRTAKQIKYGRDVTDRQRKAFERNGLTERGGDVMFGDRKVTITPAHPFFYLTPAQDRELSELFVQEFSRLIAQAMQ